MKTCARVCGDKQQGKTWRNCGGRRKSQSFYSSCMFDQIVYNKAHTHTHTQTQSSGVILKSWHIQYTAEPKQKAKPYVPKMEKRVDFKDTVLGSLQVLRHYTPEM